ncbi:fungal-specific transcription factor domain-containing protein [Gongronella butleri]|nr:fungal-specific transcription factor domain-containing protein [Gongronella butleri]
MYSGIAIRMAIELGMHKESDSDHDTQVDQPAERWMEQELRRRVFWFIYILDKFTSAATGRPAMIQEEDCDVLLPSDEYGWVNGRFYSESLDGSRMAQFNVNELRDSNLLGVSSKVSSTSSHSPPSSSASALNASKRMGTLTCQAYLIRATALLGRVAAFVNRTNRSRVLPPCHPESDFAKLAREIDEWHENLPAMYRYTPENIEKFKTAPTNHDTSRFVMLHLFLNTTIVLLHRPSLVLYDTLNSDVVQTPLKEFCKESVAKCLRAVNNVTALLKVANQSVEFMPPYLTYLCYTVATIVVNNAFSNIPDDAKKARDDLNHHFKLLQNMRRVWAMADKHYFMIRDLYAMHRNTTNSSLDHHSRSPSQASMSPSSTKWTSSGNASGTSGRSTHDVSPQSSFSQPSHQMSPTSATSQHAQPQQQQQQQPQPQPQPFPSLFPPTSIDHAYNGNNNQQQATNPAFHAINIPNRKMSLAELALSTCDGTSYSPWGVGDNRDNVTAALASSMNRSSSLMFSAQPPQQHQQQQQQPGLGLYDINGTTAMQNNNNPATSAADTLAWNLGITDPVAYSRSS